MTSPRSSATCSTTRTSSYRDGRRDPRRRPGRASTPGHRGDGRLVRHPPRGAVRPDAGARLPRRRLPGRVLHAARRPTAAGPASTTSTCTSPPAAVEPRPPRSPSTRRSPAITCSSRSRTERTDLPGVPRLLVGSTAFVEGWALYTERLADEMGLYRTDLDRLGMLGLATRGAPVGWSSTPACTRWAGPASRPSTSCSSTPRSAGARSSNEVDRYIGMPGQALAYKVGQREILAPARRGPPGVRRPLRPQGIPRRVLGGATISLPVLRTRIADWIGTAA